MKTPTIDGGRPGDGRPPDRRLTRREFARALRFGLGRARIDVRRHGLRGREDLLVAACLRDPTRTRELEGSLAGWLVAIAKDGSALGRVSREVRRAAGRPIRGRRHRGHVARVLEHLALAGDAAARRALVAMFRRARDDELVEIGVPVVRALGEHGWREVIETFVARRRVHRSGDLWWLAVVVRRSLGPRRALAALPQTPARTSANFPAAMRDAIRVWGRRPSRDPERRDASSLDELERRVASRRRLYFELHRWAEFARRADRDEAWRRIRAEEHPRRLRRRLLAMRSENPPRLRPGLFALARHEDRRVRREAIHLLEGIRDPRVRRWALAALRRDPAGALRDGGLDLLEVNGASTDAPIFVAVLPARRSGDADDDWVTGVLRAARPIRPVRFPEIAPRTGPAWDALLVRAYGIAPCRDCRRSVVEALAKRRSAPEWMLREAVWDSQDETRSIARRALRAPGGGGSRPETRKLIGDVRRVLPAARPPRRGRRSPMTVSSRPPKPRRRRLRISPELRALRRAARAAYRLAQETGTPLCVWKDGKVVDLPAKARRTSSAASAAQRRRRG